MGGSRAANPPFYAFAVRSRAGADADAKRPTVTTIASLTPDRRTPGALPGTELSLPVGQALESVRPARSPPRLGAAGGPWRRVVT